MYGLHQSRQKKVKKMNEMTLDSVKWTLKSLKETQVVDSQEKLNKLYEITCEGLFTRCLVPENFSQISFACSGH